jgi:Spy/CpxP family protein refolding chaperone
MGVMKLESLTDEQREKILDLQTEARKEIIRKRAEVATLKVDLRALLRQDEPDMAEVEDLVRRIARIKGDIRAREIRLRLEIRKLLTPEQREELKEMRRECRRGPQWRRGGPHGPGCGPGGPGCSPPGPGPRGFPKHPGPPGDWDEGI